ncbi:hypothetical protein GCK72_009010 [Caenorhabditis remanei]|uniref:Uncharacterized protein n=1 Tax=Caenorhabditis remanei TaxID=31234 RepID=A0A6A5GZ11_CAERE|nr:hypothetical protein GCK72_009010 [Caenorhabditis remanei]KAF1760760.1 hypothetical protein GCK72_009010 [Caenorhabditis remanei]
MGSRSVFSLTEVVEYSVSVVLGHLRVNVVAGVSDLCDFLGKKLDTLSGVAEDDRLVDLELAEQSVQAMNLLLLLDESVVLGNSEKSQLLHEVDLIWLVHVFLHEGSDSLWEGGGVQHDLALFWQEVDEAVEDSLKNYRIVHLGNALLHQIEDSSWSGDDQVNGSVQTHDIVAKIGSSCGDHDLKLNVLGKFDADLGSLQSQFTSWDDDHSLDCLESWLDLLDDWDAISSGLSGSVLGSGEDVLSSQRDSNGSLLNWTWLFPSFLEDAHEKVASEAEVLELYSFGVAVLNRLSFAGKLRDDFQFSSPLAGTSCCCSAPLIVRCRKRDGVALYRRRLKRKMTSLNRRNNYREPVFMPNPHQDVLRRPVSRLSPSKMRTINDG